MSNKAPAPTATTRVSIQWDNEVPEERTSTLVLTAPSGAFVDLRIFADELPSASLAHEPQPASAIDWAFSGLATHQPSPSNAMLTESTWKHWIDSRTPDALSVRDAGVSSPLPDGDTRECGEMKDAAGVLRGYEELWHDARVEPACAAVFIRFRDDLEAAARGISMCVENISPEDVCGVLIRVGGWCQGVLRDTHGFTAERWRLTDKSTKDNSGGWILVFRSGTGNLPCVRACTASHTSGREALELSTADGLWKCVELYEGASTSNLRAWGCGY